MAHKSDQDIIQHTHNTARWFTEHQQVALVLLLGTFLWGWFGYQKMPKRKDPVIPVRVAVAGTPWPGATAEQVEQLVSRPIEQTMAQNAYLQSPSASDYAIRSISFPGLSLVYVQLGDTVSDTRKQFSDINLKLDAMNQSLPQGAGPIQFNGDFGDTAALMLTVASPPANDVAIALRARSVQQTIREVRAALPADSPQPRVSVVYCFPLDVSADVVRENFSAMTQMASREGVISDSHPFQGAGYIGLDANSTMDDAALRQWGQRFLSDRLHSSEIHPDAWDAALIRDPEETANQLAAVAGDKYSYRQLDDYTDLIARSLQGVSEVAKVTRSGVLPEQIYLDYSQERLAQYGVSPSGLKNLLAARNIVLPGGNLEVGSKNIAIDPSGEFTSPQAIGDVIAGNSNANAPGAGTPTPVYLRDLVSISRGYQSPARFLNYLTWRDANGKVHRSRAVTVAVQMKEGQQIAQFGKDVDEKLAVVKRYLPDDLVMVHTSDQPLQVEENLDLFMDALYEAIALVVLVSLLGFWEWRSALLMALSIPITLAMTFGMLYVLRIDIQQVSVATLIIALGLLVDDPVVAGDAIKRSLAEGQPNIVAAWLGPTKLATAILYATITNIVAYLPFLMLPGTTGEFLFALPVVMTCALVASRVASMTFLPLLGYFLLRAPKHAEPPISERRSRGFTGHYARVAKLAIDQRWKVLAGSFVFLLLGAVLFSQLKSSFFPEDVQYWSYVDVWLPNDATLTATNNTAEKVEAIIREQAEKFGRDHPGKDGKPRQILKYVTTFVGGGGPRFWFSVSPELQQLNYAQVLIEVNDKEVTPSFVRQLQPVLSASVPGARVDVRQLQTNPINYPVEIRISSEADLDSPRSAEDLQTLRRLAGQVEDIFRSVPLATRVSNDWDAESSRVALKIDPDRANLAGVTNVDVAHSSTAAMSGTPVTVLREGDRQIPVVARLRMTERAQLSDIQNLYVYSSQGSQKIPLIQISQPVTTLETQRIVRLEHFRTISVRCFPIGGSLASEVLASAKPKLKEFQKALPPGYRMQIGGEYDKQTTGFTNLAIVMAISIGLIFLALLIQFNNALKPLLVFAAAPYGVVGAVAALWIMGTPFGFMAFLGIASLVGVIVSHVIVLFDFIEEKHEEGEPFEDAIIDAGIIRLRPVLITVGATVLALFPLAVHGGPLWQPLCYAQIGGLTAATVITLLLVPVLYSIFVLDLKLLRWETKESPGIKAPLATDTVAGNPGQQ
jgi:multidrug efflux pump subunit AcrB